MQSFRKELLLCSFCAMSLHKGDWNWEQCLHKKCPRWTENPQNVKGVGLSNSLFSFAVQMDSFLYFNKDGMRTKYGGYNSVLHVFPLCLLLSLTHVSLFQRMYVTSSARRQFITTFPSTGTVSSSGYTSAMKETGTSATQSSPSFCRYTFLF